MRRVFRITFGTWCVFDRYIDDGYGDGDDIIVWGCGLNNIFLVFLMLIFCLFFLLFDVFFLIIEYKNILFKIKRG